MSDATFEELRENGRVGATQPRNVGARRVTLTLGLAAALMAGAGGGCSTGPSPPSSALSRAACGSVQDSYLCAMGTALLQRGKSVRLIGATLYPNVALEGRPVRGSAWSSSSPQFRSYLDQVVSLAADAGLNTLRPTNFLDGASDWRAPAVWANLDYLIAHLKARGMLMVMDLSPYRNWLLQRAQFPYDPATWNAYLDFVGGHYQNEAAIAYYAIAGEVPPPDESLDKRATTEQIVAFYRATANRLRAADHSHHLVASGGLNHLEPPTSIPWQTVFALPGIDLATLHLYSAGDRTVVLPAVARWSDQASKPLVIEEFGFQQMMGDQARAAAFAGMFGLVERYAAQGAIFWNLGPELAPSSYEVGSQTPVTLDTVRKFAIRLASPAPGR